MPDQYSDSLITVLLELHNMNSRRWHWVTRDKEGEQERSSTMPLMAFIHQYFIYNSIYQVNWVASATGTLVKFPVRGRGQVREHQQQAALESFIHNRDGNGENLKAAFQPLCNYSLVGEWTAVIPDEPPGSITAKRGEDFFEDLRTLQAGVGDRHMATGTASLYTLIGKCRPFVHDVRCNIFHGRKTLTDAEKEGQSRRLAVYYLFLNCLTALFFRVHGETPDAVSNLTPDMVPLKPQPSDPPPSQ